MYITESGDSLEVYAILVKEVKGELIYKFLVHRDKTRSKHPDEVTKKTLWRKIYQNIPEDLITNHPKFPVSKTYWYTEGIHRFKFNRDEAKSFLDNGYKNSYLVNLLSKEMN